MGTVVNRALPSLHRGSLEITLTVPLILFIYLERVPIIDVTNIEEPLWLDWDDIDFGNMTGHMEDHNDRLVIRPAIWRIIMTGW